MNAGPPGITGGTAAPGGGRDIAACVYLDAGTPQAAGEVAALVLQAQNGACTFSRSAPNCFMGDTAVRVKVLALPDDPDHLLLDVSVRKDPRHLTHTLVLAGRVPAADAEAFWTIFDLTRHYLLTVAVNGAIDLERLYVVKYHAEGRRTTK